MLAYLILLMAAVAVIAAAPEAYAQAPTASIDSVTTTTTGDIVETVVLFTTDATEYQARLINTAANPQKEATSGGRISVLNLVDGATYYIQIKTTSQDWSDASLLLNHLYVHPSNSSTPVSNPLSGETPTYDVPTSAFGMGIRIPESTEYSFDMNITNPDSVPYALGIGPTSPPNLGAEITPEGIFSWTPRESNIGDNRIIIIQLTPIGKDTIEESVYFDVYDINLPPLAPDDSLNITEDSRQTLLTPAISDPDRGDTVEITMVGPASKGTPAIINTTTIGYAPRNNENGQDSFTYTVADGEGVTKTGTITVNIEPVNDPPTVVGLRNTTIPELEPFSATITLDDVDDDVADLNFMHRDTPAGMNITGDELTWTPTEEQGPGQYTFAILASDESSEMRHEFTFTVSEVNQDPVLVVPDPVPAATTGMPYSLDLDGNDGDIPEQAVTCSILSQDGTDNPATINPDTCLISWMPAVADIPGHTIRVEARDNFTSPGVRTATITIEVRFDDREPPVITLEGNETLVLELGIDEYVEMGANVTDDDPSYDGVATPTSGLVLNSTGTYTVTYTAPADASGKSPASVTRTVIVRDTTKPVIELNGTPEQTVDYNGTYVEPNATVTDNDPGYDGTVMIDVPEINSTDGGATYTVTYSATPDDAGNVPDNKTRTVTIGRQFDAPNVDPIAQNATLEIEEDSDESTFMPAISDPDMSGRLVIVSVGTPLKGEAGFNAADNTITYEPHENEYGLDLFNYTIEDSRRGTATGTVTVNITAVNDPPVLAAIADRSINEHDPLSVQLDAGDVDDEPGRLNFTHSGAPAGMNITGNLLTWTPGEGHGGNTYRFNVTVSDDEGAADSQEVAFTVVETNQDPAIRQIDGIRLLVGTSRNFQIHATDGDVPAQNLEYRFGRGAPENAQISQQGIFSWTPTSSQVRDHNITIVVSDGHGGVARSSFVVTVQSGNDPPVFGVIEDRTINENVLLDIRLNANDTETHADDLVFDVIGAPEGLDIVGNRLIWTPTEEQGGRSHTFTITVTDGLATIPQEVMITVNKTNSDPVLEPIDDRSVEAGSTVIVNSDASDGDIPVQMISYAIDDAAPADAMINSTSGRFSWTPTSLQTGNYTITITATDSEGGSDSKSFTIHVRGTGGPNHNPAAPDVQNNARLNALNRITPDVIDPDGDDITITRVTGQMLGTVDQNSLESGTILYRPNQTGIDRLTYTVEDGRGGTANGTINVYINERSNARPALAGISDTGTTVGTNVNFTANAMDSNGDPLTFDIANVPDGATINGTTGYFSWTPESSQNGTHIVTIIVHDDRGGASWQDVTITVLRAGETNRPPVPEDITTTAVIGEPKTFQPRIMDPDGDTVTMTLESPASRGTILDAFVSRGILIYIGTGLGQEEFTYTLSDGRGGVATGTIRLEVLPPANISPTLGLIGDRNINALQELAFNADATDIDSTMLTFGLIGEPAGAQITPQGAFSWTPAEAQEGRHDFTVIVSDDAGGNDTETITVNVRNKDFVNSAPIAPDIVDSTPQNTPGIIRPPISDPNDDPVRITAVTANTKGEIVTGFLRAGIVIYRPNTGQTGIDTINYTVSDGSTQTSTGTITVFINADGNRNPVLAPIGLRNINAGEQLTFNILARDRDPLSYLLAGAPAGAEISEQGVFSWMPTAADVGNHTFTIAVYDERGGSSSEVVTMRVLPAGTANGAPNAPTVTITVNASSSTPIAPEISDPDGDQVSITGATGDGSGTIIPSPDSILYIAGTTPGSETITYTVEDIRGAVSTGTITITIQ